jgi:hypothetical protein
MGGNGRGGDLGVAEEEPHDLLGLGGEGVGEAGEPHLLADPHGGQRHLRRRPRSPPMGWCFGAAVRVSSPVFCLCSKISFLGTGTCVASAVVAWLELCVAGCRPGPATRWRAWGHGSSAVRRGPRGQETAVGPCCSSSRLDQAVAAI